jgi:hypothetical protein
MKVKVSSKQSKTQKKPAQSKVASKISRDIYDKHALIVLPRAPLTKVLGAVRGRQIPANALTKRAFLITKGPKASERGCYVSEVLWDGKDLYSRKNAKGKTIYGSLKALNEVGVEGFSAAIVSGPEIAKMAKSKGEVVTVKHRSEDEDITVALLNSFGDRFVGGVMKVDGKLRAVTMEHPTSKNTKEVQYDNPRHVKKDKSRFLASLVG